MRRVPALLLLSCSAAFFAGCGSGDTDAADTMAADSATMMPPPATAMISLPQVAGQWAVRAIPESGADTSATEFVMTATGDESGWMVTFPNRDPVPVRIVSVAGDSIVSEMGPFESARRAGVQTNTTNVWRLVGDRLVGTTVARYQTMDADSVLRLRIEGTRVP